MRTKAGEKERLREKILAEAVLFLKETGKDRAPVDKIMSQAGLTSGALYSHFSSKEDLFAQAVLVELQRLIKEHSDAIAARGSKALEEFVARYLSAPHIDGFAAGCVFTALGADMSRCDPETKRRFGAKIDELFHVLAGGFRQGTAAERLANAKFLFASLVGALTLARSGGDAATDILNVTRARLLNFLKE